jgi:hypothetical protein
MFHKLFPSAPQLYSMQFVQIFTLGTYGGRQEGQKIFTIINLGLFQSDFIFWVMRQSKKPITKIK